MKKRILTIILILLISFTISGCGGGFFEEDVLQIESITTRIDPVTGAKLLVITYNDETLDPVEFEIPKGEQGNGIKDIEHIKEDESDTAIVKISYTDEDMEPILFEVKDGVSIKAVKQYTDTETGDRYLYLELSDGTESEKFLLPKGETGDDGEDGNSFTGFDNDLNDDGSQTYYFHFSKSEDVVITIPAPEKGQDGVGIAAIIGEDLPEEGLYVIRVTYSDGTEADPIYFTRPKEPNNWYKGSNEPDSELGKEGDFYFDVTGEIIYTKEPWGWSKIVNFTQSQDPLYITFYLNDGDSDVKGIMPPDIYGNVRTKYLVSKNTFFKDNQYGPIPSPVREGYIFKGWCTENTLTATAGIFTELTPILSELELYAIWEKIEQK